MSCSIKMRTQPAHNDTVIQRNTDAGLSSIEATLKNGIQDAVAENKKTISKLNTTATHLDATVNALQKQHDEITSRIAKHFSKIYDKVVPYSSNLAQQVPVMV